MQGDIEVQPAAQHLHEIAMEEVAGHLVVVKPPVRLQGGVPGLSRAGIGQRHDTVDIEDEDGAGTHGRPCYSSAPVRRIVLCSWSFPHSPMSMPMPTPCAAAGRRTISGWRRRLATSSST